MSDDVEPYTQEGRLRQRAEYCESVGSANVHLREIGRLCRALLEAQLDRERLIQACEKYEELLDYRRADLPIAERVHLLCDRLLNRASTGRHSGGDE